MIEKNRLTIFRTPVVVHLLRWLSIAILKLSGWTILGEAPKQSKFVMIAAPHTSNWDFPMMLLTVLKVKLDVHWMGKHTLFPFPFKSLMCWLGGIPIDRRAARNTVEQMAEAFNQRQSLVLILTPEGTRGKVDRWKAGFYHIANKVNVPIQLAYLDAPSKTIGFGPLVYPTGDYEADLAEIQRFYQGKTGFRSELT